MKEPFEKIRLKYLCDHITDGSHFSPKTTDDGKHYVTVTNVYNDAVHDDEAAYISVDDFESLKKAGCQPMIGDVLLAKDGTVGRTAIVEQNDYVVLSSLGILRPNTKLSSKMLKYILDMDDTQQTMQNAMAGSALRRITISKIREFSVIVPPFSKQKGIVNFLDSKCASIDEAISRQKKAIEKLEEYKRSVIIHKVSHTDGNVEYVKSNIPWMPVLPQTWDVLPLRYAVSQRVHKNNGMQEKNLLTLSYGEIKRKDIETNEGLLPASFEGYNIIEKGDIVLRLLDLQNDTHSLRTGLVKERGIITSAYVTITPSSVFDSSYCRYLLHAYDLMKVLYTMGEGVRQSLSYDELSRKMLIPVPPMDEQKKIAEDISIMETNVNEAIDRMLMNIEKLEEYKQSLIYNAVTGKIDCRKGTDIEEN